MVRFQLFIQLARIVQRALIYSLPHRFSYSSNNLDLTLEKYVIKLRTSGGILYNSGGNMSAGRRTSSHVIMAKILVCTEQDIKCLAWGYS